MVGVNVVDCAGGVVAVGVVVWGGRVAESDGNGFRGVDVHGCNVAIGGHNFVEFF